MATPQEVKPVQLFNNSTSITLYIPKIPGKVTLAPHVHDAIAAYVFSLVATKGSGADPKEGQGNATGKVQIGDLYVVAKQDTWTEVAMNTFFENTMLGTTQLNVTRNIGDGNVNDLMFQIQLENPILTSVRFNVLLTPEMLDPDNNDNIWPQEFRWAVQEFYEANTEAFPVTPVAIFTIAFSKITFLLNVIDEANKNVGSIGASWDLTKNDVSPAAAS